MKLRIYDPRILAIDLRHRRFGYAVFEGYRLLLGWGLRVYPAIGEAEAEIVTKRLTALLKLFSPSAIVVTQERWDKAQTSSHMLILEEAIIRVAVAHAIEIHSIGQDDVKASFRNLHCDTKYEIASALSRIFPELVWRLPLKRQAWQSEHPRMPCDLAASPTSLCRSSRLTSPIAP